MMNNYLNILVLFLILFTSCDDSKPLGLEKKTKIALRDVGHKLLLNQNDSTSLILPVKKLNSRSYRLEIDTTLTIEPLLLVEIISDSFKSASLPENYIIEVIQCRNNEVAYSFQKSTTIDKTVIPCGGRYLPVGFYVIEVNYAVINSNSSQWLYFLIPLGIVIVVIMLIFKQKSRKTPNTVKVQYEVIGSFRFYPEQNKLVKEAEEIALSKKECELLTLFIQKPNVLIKREELTKRVWEDNGVIVGRSLDTYISKLRKKLQSDTSIKLVNVHGVGYKLRIL
ncbi:MAG: winged helix-turn-helix transcriptional regulator [Winogradskyella sp.]|uniref:winged helix-turn-helix domain-containing protein n=1 Tax=Winogradskyella sp. TaxID=1883156 RepID=UPI0025F872FB|nr:winged helix-turn-helix domain-containing protein [Winogradskyella sp.]NRB82256.1 winged helix-turn-helix transcriptional regulator [Winogradskyella sp.]